MSKPNSNKDPQKSNVSNNPCGICRAAGLAGCKGHGARSGGGSTDLANNEKEGYQAQAGSMLFNAPTPKPKNEALFSNSRP